MQSISNSQATREDQEKRDIPILQRRRRSIVSKVENRYGNITVTHWNQNTVAIRVEVECKARSEERAQENLDRIQIETKKIGGIVSAVTTIKKEMNSNSNNESMTINYYIQMPPKLAAELNQKYGNINLPSDNNGNMDIHVKYGNLNARQFHRQRNDRS